MTKLDDAAALRRAAEARLKARARTVPNESGLPALLRLVHELQVHQIELERHNQELRGI